MNEALRPFVFALYIGLMVSAAVSLVVRQVRSWGKERQQIERFVFAAALVPCGSCQRAHRTGLTGLVQGARRPHHLRSSGGAGIAILRYRLYDIDRIINRTIVYASLTAVFVALYFVALYFGAIVLSQQVFVLLTGQRSTLAVVASTLVIAALFNPLRHRTQSFVDRRFYRRKYDVRKTLESFSARLRDETDLEALNDELLGVVRETMQPAHISLRLRLAIVPEDVRQD